MGPQKWLNCKKNLFSLNRPADSSGFRLGRKKNIIQKRLSMELAIFGKWSIMSWAKNLENFLIEEKEV